MSYNEEPIETIEYKDHTIKITPDFDPQDPREWDQLSTMICFHNKYTLGDKHTFSDPDEFEDWHTENEKSIAVILSLYLYDHSGITMRTHSFNDRWDSGEVGYIYVTKEKAREHMNWKRLTSKRIDQITQILELEIKEYDQYLTGDIYGYSIEGPLTQDSCWGYYGTENAISEAKSIIDYAQSNLATNPQLSITSNAPPTPIPEV